MFVDGENRYSSAQSVTTGSGSGSFPGVRSTNVIDHGTERRIGSGRPLYVVVIVTTQLASSGSNDAMDINLYSDTDVAFGSATLMQKIGVLAAAAAVGTRVVCPIAPDVANERYTALYYCSQTTDAFSAAGITAFITTDPNTYRSYDDAVTVS